MVDAKVAALVDNWKQNAGLELTGEQEQKLKALFVDVVTRAQARREGAKKVIEGLAAANQAKDDAAADGLLKKLREGLRQVSEGREAFLNAFDEILTASQRAAILLFLVQRAKDSGKPVEQLIDDVLIETGSSN